MLLSSRLFQDDVALKNCANLDAHHVVPGSSGDHVRKLQTALMICFDADIDPSELGSAWFGPSTQAAVLAFKSSRGILNYRGQIDPIIGIKTIRQLDRELVLKQNEVPEIRKTQDIVVHIVGAVLGPGQGVELTEGQGQLLAGVQPVAVFNRLIETEEYLQHHHPLKHFQWAGGQGGQDPSQKIADRIAQHHDSGGNVIVVGLSAGGPNVLTVGQILNGRGIRLAYAGLCDAAFASDAPSLRIPGFSPVKGENFFQTLGQEVVDQEFHGPVVGGGIRNVDFSRDGEFLEMKRQFERNAGSMLGRVKQKFVDAVHLRAVQRGYEQARISMGDMLRP